MFKREHAMRETYDILTEAAAERVAKDKQITEEKMKEKEDFYDALNKIRKQRELEEANYENTSNALYDNHLATVMEAIYISAVQEVSALTDDGIQMAQRLVENYIKENGGARSIMESKSGQTYLLDFMFECAAKAHDKDMITFLEAEEADEKEKEEEKKAKEEVKEDTEKDASDADENESGEDIEVGDVDGDGKDDSKDDKIESESEDKSEESGEDGESDKDASGDSGDDAGDSAETEDDKDLVDELDKEEDDISTESPAEDTSSEEGGEAAEEPSEDTDADEGFSDADKNDADTSDPGMEDVESSKDEDFDTKDSKADMFEKLENDDTVASAVDVIAKRVADAEAEFIKKNAEDKQKIEAIADKIDERIKAVTDTDKPAEEKEAEHEELNQEATRMITQVRTDRTQGIFEYMINMNANAIVTDKVLKEAYTLENGKLDMSRIEEATLVQYGFLEFLNTVQLENVNEDYIAKVLHQEL